MSPKRKPIPAPLACAPADRPARSLQALQRTGLPGIPTVAALLAACTALGCAEAGDDAARSDPAESVHVGLARTGKAAPPSATDPLPWLGGGGEGESIPPAPHPPVVKGEAPAVKPPPPTPTVTPAVPGGMKAVAPPPTPSTKVAPTPIPPAHKSPKLGGDVAPVDPSI